MSDPPRSREAAKSLSIERPLQGVRVLDCSRVLSGPICGRMLADLGAEVVKVEPPETDVLRSSPPHVGGIATMYAQYNVGKQNVSIDLKSDGGPELLAQLAGQADVLLANFRPGVMARLGLDAKTLRAASPRLIYTSITGWGQEGPWAERPAYAPIVQAESGTLALGGALRGGRIQGEVFQHADLYAGLMACNATVTALFHRERTGDGQHLDIAMGEALLYVNDHASSELAGHAGAEGFATWEFETFTLGNGRAVHILGSPVSLFPLLARVLPLADALSDPRFSDPEACEQHRAELVELLAGALARVPSQGDLEALLEGTPAMVAGVRTTNELADSNWAAERGLVVDAEGGLRVPVAPWRSMELTIGVQDAKVAYRGEHNRAVLSDWLEASPEAVDAWTASGVLQESPTEPPSLAEAPRVGARKR